ncbi:unnamed protein product, partial [Nesidiocoris tenuis]
MSLIYIFRRYKRMRGPGDCSEMRRQLRMLQPAGALPLQMSPRFRRRWRRRVS